MMIILTIGSAMNPLFYDNCAISAIPAMKLPNIYKKKDIEESVKTAWQKIQYLKMSKTPKKMFITIKMQYLIL